MWFKNIQLYHLEDKFSLDAEALAQKLSSHSARHCSAMEVMHEGWAKPLGHKGHGLVHQTNGKLLVCLKREDKVVPASLIKEKINEQVVAIEEEQARSVGRKERADIKDSVLQSLLPKALVKHSHTYAYIDIVNQWLVVNASSAKRAEELIALLRKSIGTLNLQPPETVISPEVMMTQFLLQNHKVEGEFTLEDELELRSAAEQSAVIRCKNVEVTSDEVLAHLATGKRVSRLAMNWQEKLSFVLHDNLSIHRIRYNTELIESEDMGGDEIAQFDADFALMSAELDHFIPALLKLHSPDIGS